jgi:hypothetical protein
MVVRIRFEENGNGILDMVVEQGDDEDEDEDEEEEEEEQQEE